MYIRLPELASDEQAGYYKASELPPRLMALQDAILRPAQELGVTHILPGDARQEELNRRLFESLQTRIITTTGTDFFRNKQMELSAAISRGGRLRVLFGEPNSAFFEGVAEVEGAHKDQAASEIMKRWEGEISEVRATLRGILRKAEASRGAQAGTVPVLCGYVGMRFRITAILCEGPGEDSWARVTLTLPPEQAIASMSLECVPTRLTNSLYAQLDRHFETNWFISEKAEKTFKP